MINERISQIESMNDSIVISAPTLGKMLRLLVHSHQKTLIEEAFMNMMRLSELGYILDNPVEADNYEGTAHILGYTKFKDKVLYGQ